jgi:aspartate-semialdehyde dehydrogenase
LYAKIIIAFPISGKAFYFKRDLGSMKIKNQTMKVAVVGATGLVGTKMLQVLAERNFPVTELLPVASERSIGKQLEFKGKKYTVVSASDAIAAKPALALFSAGGSTSLEWAPKFAAAGITVVDNSSAWRMDPTKRLIVPELNADVLTADDKIIANPNCSTIQMVVALNPLHKKYKVKRIVVSTYQSVTGTGVKAVTQLLNERKGVVGEMAYKYPIDLNAIPQIDVFLDNGYTKEEMKMVNETRKIMGDSTIDVCPTCVRVPVSISHSESILVETERPISPAQARAIWAESPGVTVIDDPLSNAYPLAALAAGKDDVFVGRIRQDLGRFNALLFWCVSDNLRKGAATNAVQIAEKLLELAPVPS